MNLFHQWLSNCSQNKPGNKHFIHATNEILTKNLHAPYFSFLNEQLSSVINGSASPGNMLLPSNQAYFLLHCGLHLYLYLNAKGVADITIDANQTARNQTYRINAERLIASKSGLQVDLGSAHESVEALWQVYGYTDVLRDRLALILNRAVDYLPPGTDQQAARNFGDSLINDIMNSILEYSLYTRSLVAERLSFDSQLKYLEAELQVRAEELTMKLEELTQAQVELRRTAIEREHAVRGRDMLLSSTSWKLYAPICWTGGLFKGLK